MRVKAIRLSWFRGAADTVSLDPNCKSIVVYGENGSGKSSFVDAVEYILRGGKIGHLSHEYSGKHQEKAVINTHTPKGRNAEVGMTFQDGAELHTEIKQNGSFTNTGTKGVDLSTWDYPRTVLRQDEVAAFLQHTKGDKYSALLPLLGLGQMEVAAENLRQLAKSIEQVAKLQDTKRFLKEVESKRRSAFGASSDDEIAKKIEAIHKKYCDGKSADVLARCNELDAALDKRIAEFSADQKRHLTLQTIANLNLSGNVDEARSASLKLAGAVEPLITEKLEVLQSTGAFVDKLETEKEVQCPACGQSISVDRFQKHIKDERERLRESIAVFETRKAALGTLCDAVKSLKGNVGKSEVKAWREDLSKGALADSFLCLDKLNPEVFRTSCSEEDLGKIEHRLIPLVNAAASASKDAPPDVSQLSTDRGDRRGC
jgi:DNA repair exonuclease SbcCD ATPase subunit